MREAKPLAGPAPARPERRHRADAERHRGRPHRHRQRPLRAGMDRFQRFRSRLRGRRVVQIFGGKSLARRLGPCRYRRPGFMAQHRLHERRRRWCASRQAPRRRSRSISRIVFTGAAGVGLSAFAGDRGAGRAGDVDRILLRSGGRRLPGQFRARTDRRRQGAARPYPDRLRRRRRPATSLRWAPRSARKATYKDFVFTLGGAVVRNQTFVRFAGEGSDGAIRWRQPAQGQAACRQHAGRSRMPPANA